MRKPRRLPSGYYQARDAKGKAIGTFRTEAEAIAAQIVRANLPLPQAPLEPVKREGETVRKYAKKFLAVKRSQVQTGWITIGRYKMIERRMRMNVIPLMGDLLLTEVTSSEVEIFIAKCPQNSMTRECWLALHGLLDQAVRDGHLNALPLAPKGLSSQKRTNRSRRAPKRRIATDDELWSIVDRLEDPWRSMAQVQFGMGLRVSEMLGLQWSQIDWEASQVHIDRQFLDGEGLVFRTKSKDDRVVPLTSHVRKVLLAWRSAHPAIGDSPVFATRHGNHIKVDAFYREWRRARAEVGLHEAIPHMMRKRYGTGLYEATLDLQLVKVTLGHQSIELTAATYILPGTITPEAVAKLEARMERRA